MEFLHENIFILLAPRLSKELESEYSNRVCYDTAGLVRGQAESERMRLWASGEVTQTQARMTVVLSMLLSSWDAPRSDHTDMPPFETLFSRQASVLFIHLFMHLLYR